MVDGAVLLDSPESSVRNLNEVSRVGSIGNMPSQMIIDTLMRYVKQEFPVFKYFL